ncbi:uncharacterized protein LOC143222620 isoform X2 [Tachypleus tridentatus]
MSTNEQEGTCVVHFLGYGNEEEVWIGDLLASQGKHARAQQELAVQGYFADNIDVENHSESMEWIGTRYGSLKPGNKTCKETVSHPIIYATSCMSYRFSDCHCLLLIYIYSLNPFVQLYVQGSNPAWQYADQLHGPSTSFILDIPPLPPFPLDDEGVTDDKAPASMLMSWPYDKCVLKAVNVKNMAIKNVVFVVHHELLYQKKRISSFKFLLKLLCLIHVK